MTQFADFAQECQAQGIELHPEMGSDPTAIEAVSAGPGHSLLRAMVAAGALLRTRPGEPLATSTNDRVLNLDAFGDDVPMRTLASMCNSSLSPELSPPEDAVALPGPLSYGKDVCKLAEGRWVTTLESESAKSGKAISYYGGLAEFFTVDGKPNGLLAAARKNIHEQTMLTFIWTTINGVAYPPGSLLSARATGETAIALQKNRVLIPAGYTVRSIGDIAAAAFMRLSAFALPLEQQGKYNVLALAGGHSIESLRATAVASAAEARLWRPRRIPSEPVAA